MNSPIPGCRLKLERADAHLAQLDTERRTFLDDMTSRVTGDFQSEVPQYVFRLSKEPPPQWWGTIVGEFAHQLRSALDNIIWSLVHLRGTEVAKQQQFVIADTAGFWKDGKKRLKGVSIDDLKKVHDRQPYLRGPAAHNHPLSKLVWLNNTDKHRLIHGCYVIDQPFAMHPIPETTPFWPIPANESTPPADWVDLRGGPFEGEDAVIAVCGWCSDPGPNPKMQVEGDLPIDVSLSDPERPLRIGDLSEIRSEVSAIINEFEPEFV